MPQRVTTLSGSTDYRTGVKNLVKHCPSLWGSYECWWTRRTPIGGETMMEIARNHIIQGIESPSGANAGKA